MLRRRAWPPATLGTIYRQLPTLNFITIHYGYFIVACLVGSAVFWASSDPHGSISYVDSLFLVVSGMTEAGLNTVNLSTMTTWQQTILFLAIIFGSTIWVSIWTILARKHIFQHRVGGVACGQCYKKSARGDCSAVANQPSDGPELASRFEGRTLSLETPAPAQQDNARCFLKSGGGCTQERCHGTEEEVAPAPLPSRDAPYLCNHGSSNNIIAAHGLITEQQRKRICKCEYHALRLLSIIVPLYFVLWQLLGCLSLGAWMSHHMPETALANGINPWWLGIFNGASAFNNSGMSLLDANMIPFQEAYFVLITMGMMILAGNTAYPIFLRLILWSGLKLLRLTTRENSLYTTKLAIKFLLKYPRRIYTHLFPARPTWWLCFIVLTFNCVDWASFELLNLHNSVVGSIPRGPRVLVGLFQALAVRSGGFYVVPIAQISIGVQFLYVIMMYIAVYPVVITMRQSNLYQDDLVDAYNGDKFETGGTTAAPTRGEPQSQTATNGSQSLATGNDSHNAIGPSSGSTCHRRLSFSIPEAERAHKLRLEHTDHTRSGYPEEKSTTYRLRRLPAPSHGRTPFRAVDSRLNFIREQIHGQLAQDIWWLVLAVLVIVIIESHHFNADPINFSVFNIIFEVVSAYGTVGISVGTPTDAYSFAGTWYTGSKLVLCLVMLRGRHRGLPAALDCALQLPSEHLHCEEKSTESGLLND
ncbi:hypothetical protein NQ176_g1305 [Zarea fungicola]|uniref:Uncharacterized protein n=1 Tax=Zarea fungicola TaxID=93591 RepID=A0ACC1NU27_9HYPO|nr:hypothetical protein NQ176_g1305 [Lecanicillium fungicola]